MTTEARYATAPVEEEIAGYGVDAHWRHTSPPKQRNGSRPGRSPPDTPAPARRVKATVLATHQPDGAPRQVLSIPVGAARLIVDRLTAGGDARLLARLDPDEPAGERDADRTHVRRDPRHPLPALTRADLGSGASSNGSRSDASSVSSRTRRSRPPAPRARDHERDRDPELNGLRPERDDERHPRSDGRRPGRHRSSRGSAPDSRSRCYRPSPTGPPVDRTARRPAAETRLTATRRSGASRATSPQSR